MEEFLKFLSGTRGGRILDVACGRGQFTALLAGKLADYDHITGIDPDADAVNEAMQQMGAENIIFLEGSAMNIPFPDESFDTVSISKGLHHLEDVRTGLSEMKRVLRKDGHLIVNEMHSEDLTPAQHSHMLYHHLKSDLDRMEGISHNHTFIRSDIRNFVDELGLRNLTVWEYTEDPGSSPAAETIAETLEKTGAWKERVRGKKEGTVLMQEIDKLEDRIRKVGISRPPMMVLTGIKQ